MTERNDLKILHQRLSDVPLFLSSRKIKTIGQEGNLINTDGELYFVTEIGFLRGLEEYKRIAERVCQFLSEAGHTKGQIFPFGSLSRGTWIGGDRKGGFKVGANGEALPYQSDIDIAVFLEDDLTPMLEGIVTGEIPFPKEYRDLLEDNIDVLIVGKKKQEYLFIH